MELVRGAGEVLDDALVQLGRDAPALGLERALGLAGELLAVARVGPRPPRLRPDERQLRGGEREEEAEEHRQERAPDAVARRVDLAGRVVGLDQDEAARREPQREVHLDEPAVAALEPVLRARQVADVGADRVVGERGAQVLRQREPAADEGVRVRVDDQPVRRPDLHADDRVAEDGLVDGAVELARARPGRRAARRA